jgi:hypothetical protein
MAMNGKLSCEGYDRDQADFGRFHRGLQRLNSGLSCLILASCIAWIAFSTAAHTQQFDLPWRMFVWNDVFDTFDSSRFFLGASTTHDPAFRNIMLTPQARSAMGRLMLKQQHENAFYDASFDAYFGYRSTTNSLGADGIVFITAPLYDYPTSSGGGLNFDGCNGYGVEFDTYSNQDRGDPSEEHIAVIYQLSSNHLLSVSLSQQTLKDSRWHHIAIRHRDGTFEVSIDGSSRATMPIAGFSPSVAYFGFSSSTGFSFNEHRVDNVSISVPSRIAAALSNFSACDTVTRTIRVMLRNTHPDPAPLSITNATLRELDAAGEFILVNAPAPMNLAPGDSAAFVVRFTGTGGGLRRAVLSVSATNGEHVEDTISIRGVLPTARWSAMPVQFPLTHVDRSADRTVYLHNTGSTSITIRQLSATPPAFGVVSPTVFPFTLAAGDSIPVVVRFTPIDVGTARGILDIGSTCAEVPLLSLLGEGYISGLRIQISDAPIMLLPGSATPIRVILPVDPSYGTARALRTVMRYDTEVMEVTGVAQSTEVFPPGSSFAWREIRPGMLEVEMRASAILANDGLLFTLSATAAKADTGCAMLVADSVTWNFDGARPGIPNGYGDEALVCINPSCRVPEGLRRIPSLKISNDPNPFDAATRVRLELTEETTVDIVLVNAYGERLRDYGHRTLRSGNHAIEISGDGLPDGPVFLLILSGSSAQYHPILHLR